MIALNPLCPACKEIIDWRNANPNVEIRDRDFMLLRTTRLNDLLKHVSHIEFSWNGKEGEVTIT